MQKPLYNENFPGSQQNLYDFLKIYKTEKIPLGDFAKIIWSGTQKFFTSYSH